MLRRGLLIALHRCSLSSVLLLAAAGCNSSPRIARDDAFGPSKVRLHPTFTQVKDWTGDGKPDGVEAVVELLDSFGGPTRGSGRLLFEMSDFRPQSPQPAGRRVNEPWGKSLVTREEQESLWSPALRAYTLQLPGRVNPGSTYVLDVSFESAGGATRPGGGRLFDRLVLEPPPELKTPDKEVKRAGGGRPRK